MKPKIEFVYSVIYDSQYREFFKIKKYPSRNSIIKYIKEIKKIWNKQEIKILKEISKVSGLKWKEKEIKCYVIGAGRPISNPLTISIFYYKNKNYFVDSLTHELIHQIQMQDDGKWHKWWGYLEKTYGRESFTTKAHISIHAIHWKLILNLFDEKRLKNEIKFSSRWKEYERSREIVEKEGYGNIIKKFRELTK